MIRFVTVQTIYPVSILYKSIAGLYRPVRVADGPITVRYIFIKNASWVVVNLIHFYVLFQLPTDSPLEIVS